MEDSDTQSKSARYRIEIKLTAEQKELITRGAAASRLGLSEFVRNAAERAARDVLLHTKT